MFQFVRYNWIPCILFLLTVVVAGENMISFNNSGQSTTKEWQAPETDALQYNEEGNLIRYGKDLIANTAYYYGPKGKIAAITNGMNCQNCHIEAGTKPFGNCFSAVASIYPTFRPRSGIVESIEFRVNDCMQRSMNGKTIDSNSKEMKAMVAYLKWLGNNVPHGTKPVGAGTKDLNYLSRAADPAKGKIVYDAVCQRCHGLNGEGQLQWDSSEYIYPPLWGEHSYNNAAGLYRISKLAGFIKSNMPYGITYKDPQLTDEEAWDVAAFIASQPRPEKKFAQDWPDIKKKSVDFPFGPYADSFTELQHKYGPYPPIITSVK
ncbi:MAG: c-type cytochrome [Sphingobacteriales bacterium]|nr:c-type cytochrome [Sphingobacteriales bacterium]MBI3720200.1 c-type cytochrome [Sphingobacteriales bacterium]